MLFVVQLADRTSIISKRSFLSSSPPLAPLNPTPRVGFSVYKKSLHTTSLRFVLCRDFCIRAPYTPRQQAGSAEGIMPFARRRHVPLLIRRRTKCTPSAPCRPPAQNCRTSLPTSFNLFAPWERARITRLHGRASNCASAKFMMPIRNFAALTSGRSCAEERAPVALSHACRQKDRPAHIGRAVFSSDNSQNANIFSLSRFILP